MALATTSWRVPSSQESRAWSLPTPLATAVDRRLESADARRCRASKLAYRVVRESIPLQRSLLPDVDEAGEKDRDEHEHLAEPEPRHLTHRTYAVGERHAAG